MKHFALLTCLLLSLLATTASALEVSPLTKTFRPSDDRGVLTLRNSHSKPKIYQVMAEEWTVENGVRVVRPATDLHLVPSLITIQPGKTQIVRFVRQGGTVASEKFYRLAVQEILHPDIAKLPGLHNTLRIEFTWIWRAPGLTPQVSARWDGDAIVIRNDGNATARIVDLQSGGTMIKKGLLDYVLPGTEQRIEIESKARPSTVKVLVNDQATDLAVQ